MDNQWYEMNLVTENEAQRKAFKGKLILDICRQSDIYCDFELVYFSEKGKVEIVSQIGNVLEEILLNSEIVGLEQVINFIIRRILKSNSYLKEQIFLHVDAKERIEWMDSQNQSFKSEIQLE